MKLLTLIIPLLLTACSFQQTKPPEANTIIPVPIVEKVTPILVIPKTYLTPINHPTIKKVDSVVDIYIWIAEYQKALETANINTRSLRSLLSEYDPVEIK